MKNVNIKRTMWKNVLFALNFREAVAYSLSDIIVAMLADARNVIGRRSRRTAILRAGEY